jgi:hypothetical protein
VCLFKLADSPEEPPNLPVAPVFSVLLGSMEAIALTTDDGGSKALASCLYKGADLIYTLSGMDMPMIDGRVSAMSATIERAKYVASGYGNVKGSSIILGPQCDSCDLCTGVSRDINDMPWPLCSRFELVPISLICSRVINGLASPS